MSVGPTSEDSMGFYLSSSMGPTFLQLIFKFLESVSLYTAFVSPIAVANFISSGFFEWIQGSSSRFVLWSGLTDPF